MRIKIHPGRYFVGDPCYAFEHKTWDEVIDATKCFGLDEDKNRKAALNRGLDKFNFRDSFIIAGTTAYGDGCYVSNDSRFSFGVDAGMLGVIPESLCETEEIKEAFKTLKAGERKQIHLGVVVDLEQESDAREIEEGYFDFMGIKVNTKDDDED